MWLLLRIGVGDVVDPAVLLPGLALRTGEKGEVVLGRQRQQGLEFLTNIGNILIFMYNHVLPMVSLTDAHGGAAGKERVQAQTDGQAGKCFL